jgi:DNA-binding GntR family transcriptional regulator
MRDSDIVSTFYTENRRMPSYEEMKSLFGVASKNTVAYRVKKLLEEGFLIKEEGRLYLAETG